MVKPVEEFVNAGVLAVGGLGEVVTGDDVAAVVVSTDVGDDDGAPGVVGADCTGVSPGVVETGRAAAMSVGAGGSGGVGCGLVEALGGAAASVVTGAGVGGGSVALSGVVGAAVVGSAGEIGAVAGGASDGVSAVSGAASGAEGRVGSGPVSVYGVGDSGVKELGGLPSGTGVLAASFGAVDVSVSGGRGGASVSCDGEASVSVGEAVVSASTGAVGMSARGVASVLAGESAVSGAV